MGKVTPKAQNVNSLSPPLLRRRGCQTGAWKPRRAGLVGRLATANPVKFQLIHAPEFRISRYKRAVISLRQGGRKRIGVGDRESSL